MTSRIFYFFWLGFLYNFVPLIFFLSVSVFSCGMLVYPEFTGFLT